MKSIFLSLFIMLSATTNSIAQYYTNQNKVWAFGYKAGLDFTSGSPVPIATGFNYLAIAPEGTASVSDTAGHLLFYTNGKKVYNRNHALMPSGADIVPFETFSTTQSAVIAPVIGNPSRYYIFSLESTNMFDTNSSHLAYNIVDMSADGGYGNVVSPAMGKALGDSLSEKMIAITGNNHNIWLLVHMKDTAVFLAYEITAAGVDSVPIVSAVGKFSGVNSYAAGVMKVSPNRRIIVSQCQGVSFGTELYDFDPATGVVSNCVVLDSLHFFYGAEFSPDNKKLYAFQMNPSDTAEVYQYNLALSSLSAIKASKTLITKSKEVSDLKLGPDKKIYFTVTDDSFIYNSYCRYIDCISSPNLPGTSCGYLSHAVTFLPGTGKQTGFPNVYVTEDTLALSSINDVTALPAISIFPNPVTTELTITSSVKINQVRITSMIGQNALQEEHNSEMIKVDISALPPNIYFIKINGTIVKKFQKL